MTKKRNAKFADSRGFKRVDVAKSVSADIL